LRGSTGPREEEQNMTSITIETSYSKITIEVDKEDMTMGELISDIIRPAILAIGYSEQTVNEWIEEG